MMKKIMLTFLSSGGHGGMETVISNFLNLDIFAEYDITLLINSGGVGSWLDSLPQSVKVIDVNANNLLTKMKYQFYYMNKINPDILIDLGIKSLVPDFLYKKTHPSVKIISWIHSSLTSVKVFNWMFQADYYWAISTGIQKQLINRGIDSEKIFLLFNPIYRQEVIPLSDDNVTHFAYVGRLENTSKNITELFDTLAMGMSNYVLDIYGDGCDRTFLMDYAEKKMINVRWHGWCSNPWAEMKKSGINYLVLTSNYEGFAMVLAEAISRGIPVVSSNCLVGPSDIVNTENGYLYELHNKQQLFDILVECEKRKNQWNQLEIQKSIQNLYVDEYRERLLDFFKHL